jgi:hypothetical protein
VIRFLVDVEVFSEEGIYGSRSTKIEDEPGDVCFKERMPPQ